MQTKQSEEPRALSLQEMEETNGGGWGCDIFGASFATFAGAAAGTGVGAIAIGLGVGIYWIAMCRAAASAGVDF